MSEQEITRDVIVAVNASGLARVFRAQSGQVKVRGAWMHLCPPGTADVLGWALDGTGRFVGIEVKKPEKGPTAVQIEWRQNVIDAGGIAVVARSATEAVQALRSTRNREAEELRLAKTVELAK